MTNTYLQVEKLSKTYGMATAVSDVTFNVEPGQMVAMLGPSGCGKTTVLRMLAGFVQPTSGDIRVEGRSLVGVPAFQRNMGMVFQSYALFPHMTVAQNIAFGPQMQGRPREEIEKTVTEVQALVKLTGKADSFPRELSGGQQQRVALARALAQQPRMLLLDEPLSNLDAALRLEVAREIRLLQKASGIATVIVTHDQEEAMAMADKLVVMQAGQVQQIGTQTEIYEHPINPFVASFIGRSNVVHGARAQDRSFRVESGALLQMGGSVNPNVASLAIRPEQISLVAAAEHRPRNDGEGNVTGEIELVTYLGPLVEFVVKIDGTTRLIARIASGSITRQFRTLDRVTLTWPADKARLFDANGNGLEEPVVVA